MTGVYIIDSQLELQEGNSRFMLTKRGVIRGQFNPLKYLIKKANTERYIKSAIPYLQRLLNNEHLKRKAEFHDLQTSDGVRKRVKTKDNSYLVNYVS